MKVALVHDWLTGMRGGEKCLEVFCELFPEATLFTLLHIKGSMSPVIENMNIQTSFVQKLPWVEKKYRQYLPLFPTAIEQFDLRGFDLVLSSSHCVAKGVIVHPGTLHICYCHTPMRYVWAMYEEYFGREKRKDVAAKLIPFFANYLRLWDVVSSQRVDFFIANSENVKRRIWRYYRREAEVIYPPLDTSFTRLCEKNEGYFLVVSALVPYKRVDLAVKAFNELGEKLIIIGHGSEEKSLRKMAKKNIEFLGWKSPQELAEYYAGCRALLFPGEEDLGIVPLEAQAFGKPVIAYGAGGVLETVKDTGILFQSQEVASLVQAVKSFDEKDFNPKRIREHALKFDRCIFKNKMKEFVEGKLQ